MNDLINWQIACQEAKELFTWCIIFLCLYLAGRAVLYLICEPRRTRTRIIDMWETTRNIRNKK